MRQPLLMPKLGLTMTEGLLAEWRVAAGQRYARDEPLFVVETDKVAHETPAEQAGVLLEIVVPAGETVPCGSVIAIVDVADASAGAPLMADASARAATMAVAPHADAVAPRGVAAPAACARRYATPLARRLAQRHGVDLSGVRGSGPRGRIRARDVEAAKATHPVVTASAPTASQGTAPAVAVAAGHVRAQTVSSATPAGRGPRKPSPLQATMARRVVESKQQIPHFYLAAEADASRLLALRADLKAVPDAPKVTLNHLIVTAVGRTLRDLPHANRVWTDEGIIDLEGSDVGVAVTTARGLLVPVVRDVGASSVAEVAAATLRLTERARAGTLGADDMTGGAITVSNAGMYDVTWMTPIVNPGQSMILGVGSVRELFRPDAAGRPELRREIGLVLAADHRLVDGVSGLEFLNAVIAYLEHPARLLFP